MHNNILPHPESILLARVYAKILSWPCAKCGASGLCGCEDMSTDPMRINAEEPVKAAVDEHPNSEKIFASLVMRRTAYYS
jgi:hypothetical protein